MTFQTFTGMDYLRIDIANNFGFDKRSWDERIEWVKTHETRLEDLVKSAEEPALFHAAVQAYRKAQAGKPSGYPISLDATCSGIQILACLTGDRKAASLVNVIDTGKREDAYTSLYREMANLIGEEAKIDRKLTKQAIMTAFYGSTAMPKKIFGEGELLSMFFKVMEENAPGCWELNQQMLAIWDPTKLVYEWVLPDNFHVEIKVMSQQKETVHFLNQPFEITYNVNAPMEGGRSLGANMVHSIDGMIVREMVRRCSYDPSKVNEIRRLIEGDISGGCVDDKNSRLVRNLLQNAYVSGFFSSRILDYLDASNLGYLTQHERGRVLDLINTLPEKPFDVLTVHDCFRCLPNNGNALRMTYNLLLAELAQSNMLSFVVSQMMGRHIPINKLDENLASDIIVANYALS